MFVYGFLEGATGPQVATGPIQGIDELGLVPVTRFRIDPGFFVAPNEILINLDVWNKLGADQKNVLNDAALWTESWLDGYEKEENEKSRSEAKNDRHRRAT